MKTHFIPSTFTIPQVMAHIRAIAPDQIHPGGVGRIPGFYRITFVDSLDNLESTRLSTMQSIMDYVTNTDPADYLNPVEMGQQLAEQSVTSITLINNNAAPVKGDSIIFTLPTTVTPYIWGYALNGVYVDGGTLASGEQLGLYIVSYGIWQLYVMVPGNVPKLGIWETVIND